MNIGIVSAIFNISGYCPVLNDKLNMKARGLQMSLARRSISVGMLLGPVTFLGRREKIYLLTYISSLVHKHFIC